MATYRVLIVDDSALTREALRATLALEPQLVVAGEAKTGEEALALVRTLQPHLVTMDLNMPGMGGLKAIEAIMRERPTPIVVISERSSTASLDLNYEAISRGALELVPKSGVFGAGADDVRRFVERLRVLASAGLEDDDKPAVRPAPAPAVPLSAELPVLLGIGSSTGGPRALAKLLSALPADFPVPIAVVQHMAEDFFDSFVRFLRDASGKKVEQVSPTTWMEPGRVYVAPPRQELFVKENLTVKLVPPPANAIISPSVDSLFFSMANTLKGRGIGVLLTGMGDDGAQGLLRMRRMGARTVAQDKASCAVFGMPKAAIELGAAEHVMPLTTIGPFLAEAVRQAPQPRSRESGAFPVVTQREHRTVLILDDQGGQHLQAAKTALEDAGYEVLTLDNPLVLARTLRRNAVDLVVLEPELKTMKGAVVVQTLRTHGLKVPICLWSVLDDKTMELRVHECHAAGHVKKADAAGLVKEVGRLVSPLN